MRGRESYSANDAGEITSRRNNNYVRRSDSYVGTQFQEHPAHYQVSLISIFGDKKTKKGAILNVKPLFCSVVAPSVPMNRTMKPVSKDIETGFIVLF